MAPKIIVILGAGPNIGQSIATHFSQNGYKVAVVARNPNDDISKAADLAVRADFSDPTVIASVFAEIKAKLGVPNVVVYNAYAVIRSPDPFSTPVEEWMTGLNICFNSAYAAAQQAVAGFRELPAELKKTFIYTGNCGIHVPVPVFMSLCVGKSAGANMIQCAVKAYGKEGFRFYFADERKEDAGPMTSNLGGEVHAEVYYDLAEKGEQGPWEYTFVKGKGYVDFTDTVIPDF